MYNYIIKGISLFLPVNFIERCLTMRFGRTRISYAQFGEDLVIENLIRRSQPGFFVDVGAHHPTKLSNTYRLYKKGWRGINIDAAPESMGLFKKYRPEDINIESGVAIKPGTLKFYMFTEPALNTFSSVTAEGCQKGGAQLKKVVSLPVQSLAKILDKHVPHGKEIDLLSIDTEGFDMEVLRSNNWDRYQPTIIVVEDFKFTAENPELSPTYQFLKEHGYRLHGWVEPSLLFLKEKQPKIEIAKK